MKKLRVEEVELIILGHKAIKWWCWSHQSGSLTPTPEFSTRGKGDCVSNTPKHGIQ